MSRILLVTIALTYNSLISTQPWYNEANQDNIIYEYPNYESNQETSESEPNLGISEYEFWSYIGRSSPNNENVRSVKKTQCNSMEYCPGTFRNIYIRLPDYTKNNVYMGLVFYNDGQEYPFFCVNQPGVFESSHSLFFADVLSVRYSTSLGANIVEAYLFATVNVNGEVFRCNVYHDGTNLRTDFYSVCAPLREMSPGVPPVGLMYPHSYDPKKYKFFIKNVPYTEHYIPDEIYTDSSCSNIIKSLIYICGIECSPWKSKACSINEKLKIFAEETFKLLRVNDHLGEEPVIGDIE